MRLFYVFRRSSGLPLWFRDFQESMAGSGGNTPACMYLGLDSALLHEDLLDLLDRVQKPDSLEVYWAVQSGALFAFASGHEDSCEELIALYDERAKADHMLDFSGNLTGIMQRLVKTQEELRGDLLLSFMAARAAGLIKIRLRALGIDFIQTMEALRNQKSTSLSSRTETGPLSDRAGKIYRALGIGCPSSITIENGRLRSEVADS